MIRVVSLLCLSFVTFGGCGPNQTSTPSDTPMTLTTTIVSARMLPVLIRMDDAKSGTT